MISYIINAVRFVVGLILTAIAIQAFFKTRASGMFFLALGFSLITMGNLLSAIYYVNNAEMDNLFSDIFDVFGLIALIIAVKKS